MSGSFTSPHFPFARGDLVTVRIANSFTVRMTLVSGDEFGLRGVDPDSGGWVYVPWSGITTVIGPPAQEDRSV